MFASSFVILCIVLFVLFNIVAVFFFKETYGIKTLNVPNLSITWGIIKSYTKYSLWWDHFANVSEEDMQEDIEIQEKIDNSILKFKYNLDADTYELWTFFLLTKDDEYLIQVKKEFVCDSAIKRFYYKYVVNDRDIKKLFVNFKKAYKSIDETSYN